jgi:hypothetical protein
MFLGGTALSAPYLKPLVLLKGTGFSPYVNALQ